MSDHFTSSDEDLEEILDVQGVPKNLDYFEETVPLFDDDQYVEHFRISREKVVSLSERFRHSEYVHYQKGDSQKISALKCITVFLWFAANEAITFRDVADRFNISKSSLHKVVRRVTYFLSNLSAEYIRWPNDNEKQTIERHFRDHNFPGVIGVIDGTHVKIDKPKEDPDSYLNRKKYYSIQAQMVCDHQRRIRDIFVGYPGSVHDSRVLRRSNLFAALPQRCGEYYILGDSGYPCLQHLLTPFKDRGHLTRRQRNYNYLLSKNRYVIEHCFGLLKQRFRQLYHIKLRNISDIVHFIRATAVLHNIAIDDNLPFEHQLNIDAPHLPIANRDEIDDEDDVDGVTKRNAIMNSLNLIL